MSTALYLKEQQPVATIDVGTNTALLLISIWKENQLIVLHDETRFVRLGKGVDASGVVNAAAMARLGETLKYYKKIAEDWQVSRIIIGATSASRDAANQDELIDYVKRETGLDYGIISGLEEAEWSFSGVGSGLKFSKASILTLDIGGGSTELTQGSLRDGVYVVDFAKSLNIGSVRLTEKFFANQPPAPASISEATDWLHAQLDLLPAAYKAAYKTIGSELIGASGTTNVLALLESDEPMVNIRDKSMLGILSKESVQQWCGRLLKMREKEVLALNPAVMKGREDVFPAGVLILKTVMEYLGKEVVHVNTWGLRHGLALRYWNNRTKPKS